MIKNDAFEPRRDLFPSIIRDSRTTSTTSTDVYSDFFLFRFTCSLLTISKQRWQKQTQSEGQEVLISREPGITGAPFRATDRRMDPGAHICTLLDSYH